MSSTPARLARHCCGLVAPGTTVFRRRKSFTIPSLRSRYHPVVETSNELERDPAHVRERRAGAREPRSRLIRAALSVLPNAMRPHAYREFMLRAPGPIPDLSMRLARNREDLAACYRLTHELYVKHGYMEPHASGMRITAYNALPTTTTLLAERGGVVVGTITLIRENSLGFPSQRVFDLEPVRATGGRVMEMSGLAVRDVERRRGQQVLFSLMKFALVYARDCFDIRHIVIAVHPSHFPFYSALGFRRLGGTAVGAYDFVNGAPAMGGHVDLRRAPVFLRRCYGRMKAERNLYEFFCTTPLEHSSVPDPRSFDPNRPLLTPDLLHHFFVERTSVLDRLGGREKSLLKALYDAPEYQAALPASYSRLIVSDMPVRRHLRFEVERPAELTFINRAFPTRCTVQIVQASQGGFVARIAEPLPRTTSGELTIALDSGERSVLKVKLTRRLSQTRYAFHIEQDDEGWRSFVVSLQRAAIDMDLDRATSFLRAMNA
jgi:hypothetical protein